MAGGGREGNDDIHKTKDKDKARMTPKITLKYANTKQTLWNGIATVDQARNYIEFKSRLRKLCHDAGSTDDDDSSNPCQMILDARLSTSV